MQYIHLKTKAQLLAGAFVGKHQVVVCNSVFWSFEAICTGKDGLRWVTFSAENVGQLIYFYYISGKLEHIYPEMQEDNSQKDDGSKQHQWQTVEYCNRKYAWDKVNIKMQFIGERMKAHCISNYTDGFRKTI